MTEQVGKCPYCSKDVRRCDPRGIDADEVIGCFSCITAIEGRCGVCGKEVTRQHKRTTAGTRGLIHQRCSEALDRGERRR